MPQIQRDLTAGLMVARVSGMQTQSLMRPLIVLALIFVAGCSSLGNSQSARSDQRGERQNTEAVPVSTAVVMEKPVPLEVPAVGTAEATSSVQIARRSWAREPRPAGR